MAVGDGDGVWWGRGWRRDTAALGRLRLESANRGGAWVERGRKAGHKAGHTPATQSKMGAEDVGRSKQHYLRFHCAFTRVAEAEPK